MSLTDTKIKNIKPNQKKQKIYDGGGLYLEVSPKGGKWWRFKYRFAGKEKLLSLGTYPDTGLKDARARRDDFRKLLANGVDPSQHRKATKEALIDSASNSFEIIAREWHSKYSLSLVQSHSARVLKRLEKDIFPWLGSYPIRQLTPKIILSCIRRIEERGAVESAHRALQNCSQIFRYAVATGRVDRDPTSDLRGAIPPSQPKHFAAVTEPERAGELLRIFDSYKGTFIVQCALKLAPLVFVRPGELRKVQWKDIDLEKAEWRYDVTKTKTQHIVPLSKQAIKILKEIHSLTGTSHFVFPSSRNFLRPMSDNAILAALRRLEIPKEEMSGHGFRAMARTILDEVLGFPPHLIEHQLAHSVRDPNGRAYNRTAHLPQRKEMMQSWSDYLDEIKKEKLVLLKKEVANG